MSDLDDIASRLLDARVEECREYLGSCFDEAAAACGSPIERLMLARLMLFEHGYGTRLEIYNSVFVGARPESIPLQTFEIAILPQWRAGKYTADFLLLFAAPSHSGGASIRKFVIECDGHDFHEKTKAQAARDKARDRFFTSMGCQVLRYTGSEIYRNSDDLLSDLGRAITTVVEGDT
jgi:very-short-patch-repair endonuclease